MQLTKGISSLPQELDILTKKMQMNLIHSVLDMTANAGGQGLYFSRFPQVKKIELYEIDKPVFQLLKKNIKTLPLFEQQKIKAYNKSSLNVKTYHDLVILDVPWEPDKKSYKQTKDDNYNRYRQQLAFQKDNGSVFIQNPLNTITLGLGKKSIKEIVYEQDFKFLILKIPLNCEESPFSNDFKPLKLKFQTVPIIYNGQVKYIILIVEKFQVQLKMEQSFVDRLTKINLYQDQLQHLSNYHKDLYQKFITSRLQSLGLQQKFVINFKMTDEQFFNTIYSFTKENKYNPISPDKIIRAQQKVDYYSELLKNITTKGASIADIGAGGGILSKLIAEALQCGNLDMYEPFVPEQSYKTEIKNNFIQTTFDNVTQKYDIIMLNVSLHQIFNPQQIIKKVKQQLNNGGLLLMSELTPVSDQDKMYLHMCEKFYAFGITDEKFYNKKLMQQCEQQVFQLDPKDLYFPPKSYFTKKQLEELVGGKPDNSIKEMNYELNGFREYMYWRIF